MLAFLDDLPWGDVEGAIRTLEEALRLALEATVNDFQLWEDHADSEGFPDEFDLSQEQIDSLSDQWRIAYIARLLRSIALAYGVSVYREGPLVGNTTPASVGGVVRELNDISWIDVQDAADPLQ